MRGRSGRRRETTLPLLEERDLRGLAALAVCLALAAATTGTARADDASVRRGRGLYEIHCQSCHGADARGRGPRAAELHAEPTDLTRIRIENDGVWWREELARVVDGRGEVSAHGRREMPVWGLSFQNLDRPESQESEVAERIDSLLAYLESIQEESD